MDTPKTEDLVFFLGAQRVGPGTFLFDDGSIFNNKSLSLLVLSDLPEYSNFKCLAAHFRPGTNLPLQAIPTDCNLTVATNYFYFSVPSYPKDCYVDPMEFYLNPTFEQAHKSTVQKMTSDYHDMFDRLDKARAYKSLFSNLWHSSLPCFEITGLTTMETEGFSAMLRYCVWKGIEIPCSAIFSAFPTDKGMCCTFNMQAADQIFTQGTYTNLIVDLQEQYKLSSLQVLAK